MGYQTKYELEVQYWCPDCGQISNCSKKVEKKIRKESLGDHGYGDATYAEVMDGAMEECKWYSHPSHMRELSQKYPNVLFTLSGEGEESGDVWKKYFLNGKCQEAHAQITFPDFDFKQLY